MHVVPPPLLSPPLQKLLGDLELTSLPTSQLVLKFQTDLFQQCKDGRERGTLTVSVGYLRHKSALEVTVVAAKGLLGLDKTGEAVYYIVCVCSIL